MAFRILDQTEIRKTLGQQPRRPRPASPKAFVTMVNASRANTQQFVLSRQFNPVLGDATHVAIEFDDDKKVLAIRPSAWGEPAFKLHRVGYDRGDVKANRSIQATRLRKFLGIPDGVKGRFSARAKGGVIYVNLKRAFRKAA